MRGREIEISCKVGFKILLIIECIFEDKMKCNRQTIDACIIVTDTGGTGIILRYIATYVNPQLSPQLTEKLKQKIIGTTRLRQSNNDDAHYDISGYVSQYYTSTTGISNNNASTNRLSVSFHLFFKNALDEKKNFEADLARNFDFPASQSLSQAEAALNSEIVKSIVDEIFNKIFSNW